MSDRADSLLTFDLRAFARDYAGTPFGSRCKTAADELDRLYEVERQQRQYWKPMASAPKDGSRFLIERDIPSDTSMAIAFWHDGKDEPGFVHGDSLGRAVDLNIYTMWRLLPHPALAHPSIPAPTGLIE